uniref:Ig-like domain-containing protein n=1 Tax=Astyanax mexicanus TaxID=7994 RepID=A0A8B9K4L7_ASTMX
MVVGPAAPLVAVAGEDLILPCSLQPSISAEGMMVEWIRLHETDRQVHLYEEYKDRNGDQMESYRGRTALFKEELKKGNASLKLSALQPSDDGAYKCLITSFDWYDDVTLYVEVKGEKRYNFSSSLLMILHLCCTYKLCTDPIQELKLLSHRKLQFLIQPINATLMRLVVEGKYRFNSLFSAQSVISRAYQLTQHQQESEIYRNHDQTGFSDG